MNVMNEIIIQEERIADFAGSCISILENLQAALEIAESFFGTDPDMLTEIDRLRAEKADRESAKLLNLFKRIQG